MVGPGRAAKMRRVVAAVALVSLVWLSPQPAAQTSSPPPAAPYAPLVRGWEQFFKVTDRKSTRLNSSHVRISYAVFCLKKKKAARFLPRDRSVTDENHRV